MSRFIKRTSSTHKTLFHFKIVQKYLFYGDIGRNKITGMECMISLKKYHINIAT